MKTQITKLLLYNEKYLNDGKVGLKKIFFCAVEIICYFCEWNNQKKLRHYEHLP